MIKIYGTSDDRIEIEGDVYEEFNLSRDPVGWIATSNGALVRVSYDGEWHFRVRQTGYGAHHVYPAGIEQTTELAGNEYSDVVIIEEPIKWVLFGDFLAAAEGTHFSGQK